MNFNMVGTNTKISYNSVSFTGNDLNFGVVVDETPLPHILQDQPDHTRSWFKIYQRLQRTGDKNKDRIMSTAFLKLLSSKWFLPEWCHCVWMPMSRKWLHSPGSNPPVDSLIQSPRTLSRGWAAGTLCGRGHSIRTVPPSCTDSVRRRTSSYSDISE